MNPLAASHSNKRKHRDDSWWTGYRIASLLFLLASVVVAFWQYRPDYIRLLAKKETLQSTIKISLRLYGDHFCMSVASAAVFFVVIVLYIFLKVKSLTTSNPTSGRMTCESSCPGDERGVSNISPLSYSRDDDDDNEHCRKDKITDTYQHFYDFLDTGNDKLKTISSHCEKDSNECRDIRQTQSNYGYLVSGLDTCRQSLTDCHKLTDKNGLKLRGPVCCSDLDFETAVLQDHVKSQPNVTRNVATQTHHFSKPCLVSSGTMTSNPYLVDASVGSQKVFKIVRSCDTSTSGPFMKKLRRAQRLLNEARVKLKKERQFKLVEWKSILSRYKHRVKTLLHLLEKKDILVSYTALNRALCENEVKDMCTAVSSARDRLLTQCKLNFALKEVVESKCDSGTPDLQGQSSAAQS